MSKKNIWAFRKTLATMRGKVYYYWHYSENVLFVFPGPGPDLNLSICNSSLGMAEMEDLDYDGDAGVYSASLAQRAPSSPRAPSASRDPPVSLDPMLQMISLQRASGSWLLESPLAAVFGRTLKDVESATPASVCCCLVWFGTSNICWIDLIGVVFHHKRKNERRRRISTE